MLGIGSKLRRNFMVSPENAGVLKKGPVEKLVLKGAWENRKWNDRWIELLKGEFRYCWKEGSRIDSIAASSISSVKTLHDQNDGLEIHDERLGDEDYVHSFPMNVKYWNATTQSIWPTIVENSAEDMQELQNGFLLQTISGDHVGREYFFRTSTHEEAISWIGSIRAMVIAAQPRPKTAYTIARAVTRKIFQSPGFTIITTMLILLNFSAFVFDTQVVACSPVTTAYKCPPPLPF
jgi:hypothetical protein